MFATRLVAAVAWWLLLTAICCGGVAGILQLEQEAPFVYDDGQRCDVETGCLSAAGTSEGAGVDALGDFYREQTIYLTPNGAPVTLSTRYYDNGIQVFRQEFSSGLQGTSTGDKDAVSTCFPRLRLPDVPDLRYITPGGYMAGWTLLSHGSIASDLNWFRDGEDGGFVVLFSGEIGAVSSVVISSLTQPMATNVKLDRGNLTLDWGVQGQAEDIHADYASEVILVPGEEGIGENIMAWGNALRQYHTTQKIQDPSAEYLSYYTDNGAAHYYNPLPYGNLHDALMSVYNFSVQHSLPIRRLQLDSWWYHKGAGGGVKNWTEIPAFLPHGIAGLSQATGWPIVAHNRYFSSDTDYAQQNGGSYLFTVDEEEQKSLPLDQVFWDDLLDDALAWGLDTYEQDWLDRQYLFTSAIHTNLTLGSSWLNDMNTAALERGINIQYCMSLVRQLLHSVTLPAVTQIRVSDDYILQPDQWRIGVTSLLAHALQLRPYKDVFWSSHKNPDVLFIDCELLAPDLNQPWRLMHLYGGRANVSESGKPCVAWRDIGWDDLYYGSGMDLNLCRNPENIKDGAFCFTNASFDMPEESWEWEYCDVPVCEVDCFTLSGVLYVGGQNVTQSGRPCVDWGGEYGIDRAVCRNPNNDVAPWCYVTEGHTERDYCDNKCPEATEPNPALQAAVSTLSAGPLGVGDKAEELNVDLIMKSCNADGRLLHPSKPLTVVDGYFFSADYREVWTAYSQVESYKFGIIFLAEVDKALTMTASELNLADAFTTSTVVFSNYPQDLGYRRVVSPEEALDLPSCGGYLNFCLLYTAPLIQTDAGDLYILGELEKWVPVSPDRITDIVTTTTATTTSSSASSSSVTLSVRGVQGESVTLSFSGANDFSVTCVFQDSGMMTLNVGDQTCIAATVA